MENAEELAGALPPDEQGAGFSNNADALVVTSLLAGTYIDVSEKLAAAAVGNDAAVASCAPEEAEPSCVDRFVTTFGKRAFRRPVTQDEKLRYAGIFSSVRAQAGFAESVGALVRAFLQSPQFLYRVEVGVPADAGQQVVPVTPYELATRLSYSLWGTMPDPELLSAADTGGLAHRDGIEQQVTRMLTSDRAHRSIARFHREWLHIDGVSSVSKDPAVFPAASWNPTLQSDLRNELETFVSETFWNGGSLEALLSGSYSYLNPNLAAFYGVSQPAGDGFTRVDLNPNQRAGILTSGALLSSLAYSNQTSPVHRGRYVREQILCQPLPDPPNNIVIKVPAPTPGTTTRQRFTEHSREPLCKSCHRLMDPIGFGFENYDAIGRYRTEDGPTAVDASGEVFNNGADPSPIDGPFVGAVELAHRLANSQEARDCAATQVFRYAVGRADSTEDVCSITQIRDEFKRSGYDLRRLWVAVTTSDAFRYRSVQGGGT